MTHCESIEDFLLRGGKIKHIDLGVKSSFKPNKCLRDHWQGVTVSAGVKRLLSKPEPQTRELPIDAQALGRVENGSIKDVWHLRTGIPVNPLEQYVKPGLSAQDSKILFLRLELRLSFKEIAMRTGRKAATVRQIFHRVKVKLLS